MPATKAAHAAELVGLEPVVRMAKDLRQASGNLSTKEARFLVDLYYNFQEMRMTAKARLRAMEESGEPHDVIEYVFLQAEVLEAQIHASLDRYSLSHPIGIWMRGVKGIGPCIAAGLLANLDIERAPTAGHFWAVSGVGDPEKSRRKRGEKINFNPSLKRLAWIIGHQFERLSSDDADAYYRQIYDARKTYENTKNDAGDYAPQAAAILATGKYKRETDALAAYKAGKLPPGHIRERCCRYAAKMFLSHVHHKWYRLHFGKEPPAPFAVAHLGHVHIIPPPA